MLLRVPTYYEKFHCLAGACKHSCCIGWEIDIDEDTYDYYRQVPGAFGQRLRTHMVQDEVNSFALAGDGRCPFLNRENLCDICIALGEEALSEVCTEYPRFVTEYGDVREKSMAISCEEVARLVLGTGEPFSCAEFSMEEAADEYEDPEWDDEEERALDPAWYRPLELARDAAICVCQKRELSIRKRMELLLGLGSAVQEQLVRENTGEIKKIAARYEAGEGKPVDLEAVLGGREERYEAYAELEVLDEEWEAAFKKLRECFDGADAADRRREWIGKFEETYDSWQWEYEQLLVYFIFRYTMQTVYDCNFLSHMCYAVESLLMIRDLDAVRFMEQGGRFTLQDQIDIARIYSREVEHSEENLEMLQESFQFRAS